MRITLLTPLRRQWPVSAAVAGQNYCYKRKAMLPDWPTEIYSRKLPDGRFEISMDGVAPAVISPGLSCTRTNYQCWQILRLLDVYGKSLGGKMLPMGRVMGADGGFCLTSGWASADAPFPGR